MGACGYDCEESQGTTGDEPAEFFDNYPCYKLREIGGHLETNYDQRLMREALDIMAAGTEQASNLFWVAADPSGELWPAAHTFVKEYVAAHC